MRVDQRWWCIVRDVPRHQVPLIISLTITDFLGAANKFPDQCEANPQSARSINVGASANLARLCAQRSIFLIYISTDYVFPGVVGEAPYEADHPPRPINVYGQSKWEGEQAVAAAYDEAGKQGQCVALRVPVLYGSTAEMSESSINALVKVVYKAQEQETKVDHYATRYPTCIEDVGRVCVGTRNLLW